MDEHELQERLDALSARAAALESERDAALAERDAARGSAAQAVTTYRTAIVEGLPEPARALVAGDSVAAIDAAAATARRLVEEITAAARAETMAAPVPSGGTLRQPPDLSALSSAEKIRQGIVMRDA
jgi:hypothetical protein